MSAGIKRMLAERAARQNASPDARFAKAVQTIRDAAPRLDANFASATEWRPSEALMIGFCVLATSARPEGAYELLNQHISTTGGDNG